MLAMVSANQAALDSAARDSAEALAERLTQARDTLPDGIQPQIGPVTTGLGEVVMYTVRYRNPGGKGGKALGQFIANGKRRQRSM